MRLDNVLHCFSIANSTLEWEWAEQPFIGNLAPISAIFDEEVQQ
jgi:hypothetical protein